MTRQVRQLAVWLLVAAVMAVAHQLLAAALSEHDVIAALLVERRAGVAAMVAALLGVRVTLHFLLPGLLLYCVARLVAASRVPP